MIHHFSIAVENPQQVAGVLAELFEATITPFGPYPGSYTVWTLDKYGTAIELFPAGTEMIPDEGRGQANFVHNDAHSGFSATHAAISIDRTRAEIFALAEKVSWRALELSRGPFHVIEFWLENRVLIELLTPDMVKDYRTAAQPGRLRGS